MNKIDNRHGRFSRWYRNGPVPARPGSRYRLLWGTTLSGSGPFIFRIGQWLTLF
ncbi:hypothetical protein [Spirosoma lituiforme]